MPEGMYSISQRLQKLITALRGQAVQKVHVNLVDLVDTGGEQVEIFDSLSELQDYTFETGKFFPKESAYAGGVLKALLREILNKRRRRTGGTRSYGNYAEPF